jgi:hypothetical protein
MKYFTPEMWLGFNSRDRKTAYRYIKGFDSRLAAYERQLRKPLAKLNPSAARFFKRHCLLHDCTLARFEIGDRIDDLAGDADLHRTAPLQAMVRMFVKSRDRAFVYSLKYLGVSRATLNFPGQIELFRTGEHPNFGDWGYDELTLSPEGKRRHEILFASGSAISIEFENIHVKKHRATSLKRRFVRVPMS